MKKTALNYYLNFIFLLSINMILGQVGIGTTSPNGALEISSTNQGLIIPRVSLIASNVSQPVINPNGSQLLSGTMVYNTATAGTSPNNVIPGFYFWDGSKWLRVTSQATTSNTDWSLTGNTGTTAGTNFIGTSDATDLVTKTDNAERMRITATGNVGIGTNSPEGKLHVKGGDKTDLTLQTNDNTLNHGIAFQNSGGAYSWNIYKSDAGNNTGDLRFAGKSGSLGSAIDDLLDYVTFKNNGNIGIGTTTPTEKLEVNGKTKTTTLQMTSGAGENKILQSDASGNGSWTNQSTIAAANEPWYGTDNNNGATSNNEDIYQMGKVGIGTNSPTTTLHVRSTTSPALRIVDGNQGNGKILTSDASGNATWQDNNLPMISAFQGMVIPICANVSTNSTGSFVIPINGVNTTVSWTVLSKQTSNASFPIKAERLQVRYNFSPQLPFNPKGMIFNAQNNSGFPDTFTLNYAAKSQSSITVNITRNDTLGNGSTATCWGGQFNFDVMIMN